MVEGDGTIQSRKGGYDKGSDPISPYLCNDCFQVSLLWRTSGGVKIKGREKIIGWRGRSYVSHRAKGGLASEISNSLIGHYLVSKRGDSLTIGAACWNNF